MFPRIVFVGAHVEALTPLRHLIEAGENIVGLFTLESDRLAQMSGGVDMAGIAQAARIPLRKGTNVNSVDAADWFRMLNPDVMLVIGWTQLVKAEILSIPRVACLGFHASLLPKYRGRAPINWALIHGETETGNTMMVLEPGADEGDIVSQRRIPITDEDDCATLYEKVSQTECDMLDEVLPLIREGKLPRLKQNSHEATVMPKRKPEDGLLDWGWSAKRLHNWVRALTYPYPGAFTYHSGKKITIWTAAPNAQGQLPEEEIGSVHLSDDGYPLVVTGDGTLKLLRLEREGEASVSGVEAAKTFLKPSTTFSLSRMQVSA